MAAYFLTEKDVREVRNLLAAFRGRPSNTSRGLQDRSIDHEEFPAPETYIAKVTTAIPGREGLVPGTELCDIYEIHFTNGDPTTPTLASSVIDQRVYNLSQEQIPDESWVIVTRDKFGRWLVVSSSTDESTVGTGTESHSPCESIAKIKTTDCVVVHTGLRDYILGNSTSPTPWTSTETFNWGTGSGVFLFEWNATTGLADLKLGGLRLLNCGEGCYVGGPLTGHGDNTGNSCNGITFTVCVECHCCPDPMWHGDDWYCVKVGTGVGTADAQCEPLYLTEVNACDVEICSGPYATYELALVRCPDASPDAPCPSAPTPTYSADLTVLSGAGPCATSMNGLTASVVPNDLGNPAAGWSFQFNDPTSGLRDFSLSCSGGVWTWGKPLTDTCQGGLGGGTCTIVTPSHLRFTTTLGGAFCVECDNETINVQVDITL